MSGDLLRPYGWGDRWSVHLQPGHQPGRVIRHDGSRVLVATPEPLALPVRGAIAELPVSGDWVGIADDAVAEVLPRASLLRRRGPDGGEQPLAANVDLVLIVCGLDRPVSAGRLQRAVAAAWDAGAAPVVVLTKADLGADAGEAANAVPEVDVVLTSITTGEGIDELARRCRDNTVVLLGESGAGKSSLTNALVGRDAAAVGAVRGSDNKGRHTTTTRELHLLRDGGVMIDSPGVRAYALWGDEEAVDAAFPDIEALASTCRFNDCGHDTEPGCAVRGAVDAERLDRWRALRQEITTRARSDHEKRRAERLGSRMAREAQRHKPG